MKMHYKLLSNKERRQGRFDPIMVSGEDQAKKDFKEWEI